MNSAEQTGQENMALPEPDADAIAHSERLIALIRDAIQANDGKISFARFMELALYAPGAGYYSAGSAKLGAAGDFITAPEISPLFSCCIARQCAQIISLMGNADIFEIGAGAGTMACDVLAELERIDALPKRYYILDLSAELKARQQELIAQRVPHLIRRIHWLDTLPEEGFNGIILANELLDAMPVHRIHPVSMEEDYVVWKDNRFAWQRGSLSDARLQARIQNIKDQFPELDNGNKVYTTEINLAAEDWLCSIAAILSKGMILIIDYGYPRHEYYLPERTDGTLMCHYRHRAHADPFVYPGLQDITTHIDFTALAETAVEAGLSVSGYTTQAAFLLANGLTDRIDRNDIQQVQQIKRLTLPTGMGELFKVIALTKEVEGPFQGFMLQDRRGRL